MIAPNPYAELVGGADPLELLAATPERIAERVRGWDAAQWARSYAPGKWSAAQTVLHLAQDEIGWGSRARVALSDAAYTVRPYDGALWVERESPPDPWTALDVYRTLRRLDLDMWRRLSPADLARPIPHPEFGEISVGWIAELLAGHDLHHLAQLETIAAGAPAAPRRGAPPDAHAALERLREGNRRFASNVRGASPFVSRNRRAELASGQQPFAIVLGCSDSRVPAELVFDQGLGDLFVIRVAGNVVAPSQIGSVEFAAARFGTRLVVVLGHSQCGAVLATIEALRDPAATPTRGLASLVDRVRPSVAPLAAAGVAGAELVSRAVRANIAVAVDHLRHGSPILERLEREEGLLVVGAEYELATGVVTFFG